ncbi:MAG: DUF4837 family protein [Bacteroidales bacterium]|nr:DUF4837 family protein [Bacteroidales bacterium]
MKSIDRMMKPDASGGPYEVYLVLPDEMKGSALSDTLTSILEYPMECTPHGDSYFKTHFISPENFSTQVIRIIGNVILVDIDPNNSSEPFITIEKDKYAKSQVIVKAHAKTEEALAEYLPTIQENLRSIFVNTELNRRINIYKKESNHTQGDRLMEMQDVVMLIPETMHKPGVGKTDKKFFWVTDDGMAKESHIVVYSIPYNDQNVFSLEGAIAVRDSVMKANIEGGGENSYMTTNKNVIYPEYKALNVGGKYVGELRGMWRIENGLMAGPFVCHIRLDEMNQRVVFAEGFCYAPNDNQRLLIRNLEAALFTLKLPSDNMMSEIEINLSDTIKTTLE